MDVQEETSGETGRRHLNKEPRLKTGAMFGKQDNTWQDLQEDHSTELEVTKQIGGTSIRLQKMSD
jgi:hypothetical protein